MASLVARHMVERFVIDQPPQQALIAVPLTFLILATGIVPLRIYARRLKNLSLGADDFLCIAALVLAFANQAAIIVLVVAAGAGLAPMEVMSTPGAMQVYFKTLVADYLIWQAAVCCIQCSIIFFYLRLFGRSLLFRNVCYGMLGLCVAWWISSLVVVFAACNPVYLAWNPMLPGTCIDTEKSCTGLGIAHVIFDFFILSLPLPVIWNLQMKRSNKIVVSSILLVAVFATVCSILRMACIITLIDGDPTQVDTQWMALLFQNSEVPIAIICTCVPTLSPVWQAITDSRLGSSIRSLLGGSSPYGSGSRQQWAHVGEGVDKPSQSKGSSRTNTNIQVVTDTDIEFLPLHGDRSS
ncbi:hypothetical protein F5883DRAFT_28491 [Diaporthe sp. PMI_573]|nr:hypothetical protein F5883DRAFT_28491 [Diaporthaceae sp. PMI_573]